MSPASDTSYQEGQDEGRGELFRVIGDFTLNYCIVLPPKQITTCIVSGKWALSTVDYLINENEKTWQDRGEKAKPGVNLKLFTKINSRWTTDLDIINEITRIFKGNSFIILGLRKCLACVTKQTKCKGNQRYIKLQRNESMFGRAHTIL